MKHLPNFLVIGVEKAGTTALYNHLRAHPQIYMPALKEPDFFSYDGTPQGPAFKKKKRVIREEAYYALFDGVRDEQAIGEASPRYFHSPVAPARINALLPEVRLIALLRHPVERAYSHYLMMMNSGTIAYRPFVPLFREKAQSVETWAQEPLRCYGFLLSFYFESLQRYFDHFPRDRIRVYLFEDYVADPRAVLADIFDYLGVETAFTPDIDTRHNPTHGIPKNTFLHRTVMRPNLIKTIAQKLLPGTLRRRVAAQMLQQTRTDKPALPKAVRDEFTAVYREDILKVQTLLGRDLSLWF